MIYWHHVQRKHSIHQLSPTCAGETRSNPFTAMLAAPSLKKQPIQVPNLKPLRLFSLFARARERTFTKTHIFFKFDVLLYVHRNCWLSVESRFVIGPSNIVCRCVCLHFSVQKIYKLGQLMGKALAQAVCPLGCGKDLTLWYSELLQEPDWWLDGALQDRNWSDLTSPDLHARITTHPPSAWDTVSQAVGRGQDRAKGSLGGGPEGRQHQHNEGTFGPFWWEKNHDNIVTRTRFY